MLSVFVAAVLVVFVVVFRRSRTRRPGFRRISSQQQLRRRLRYLHVVVVRLRVRPSRPLVRSSSVRRVWCRVWGALSGRFGLASRSGMGSRYLDSALLLPSLSRLSSVPGATALSPSLAVPSPAACVPP